MKSIYILAGIILALSLTAFGQKQKTEPIGDDVKSDSNSSSSSTAKNSKKTAKSGEEISSLLSAGTSLEAELQSMIDVRKSNVGDQVVLKTTKAIKQNGEVVVPKGAKLIGRITEVKQKTKDDATSKVGMVFERIQGKDLDIPVNASIIAVTTARATAAAGDLFGSDIAGSGSANGSASARPSSGGSSGGGLLGGGAGGGLLGGVTSTAGGVLNTTTSTVGNVAGSAVNTAGGATSTVGRTVNGLQISQSASGSANSSSAISAKGKDVRVEKGATFQLRLDGAVSDQE